MARTLLVSFVWLAGCASDGAPAPLSSAVGGGLGIKTIKLTSEQNYTYVSSLNVASTSGSPGIPSFAVTEKASFTVSWAGLRKDIQNHPLDQSQIKLVVLIKVNSPNQTTVASRLNAGTINSLVLNSWQYLPASTTSAQITDFRLIADPTKPLNPTVDLVADGTTYLMLFSTGTRPGFDTSTMLFVQPTPGAQNPPEIAPPPDSSTFLTFTADLVDRQAVPVPVGNPELNIDWTDVQQQSPRGDFTNNAVDRILIGFYQDKLPKDLQDGFLDLEQPTPDMGGATQSWEVAVAGVTHADLANNSIRTAGSPMFTGFTTENTWILGMFCGSCQNPAPMIVTVLAPH